MVENCYLHAPVHLALQRCPSCLPHELDAIFIPVPHSKWNLDCGSSVVCTILWLTIIPQCYGTQRQTELMRNKINYCVYKHKVMS